jgi:Fe2+ or Zn2+ uptake regulation protein
MVPDNRMQREFIIRQLRYRGLRITNQRLAIIDALVEKERLHPGVYLIHKEAKKRCRSLSLSSVYATIHEFSRCGIIKMLQFDGVENRCESDLEDHINLVCDVCREIIDYKLPMAIKQREVSRKTGFTVTNNRLECYGYCRKCKKDKPNSIVREGSRNARL